MPLAPQTPRGRIRRPTRMPGGKGPPIFVKQTITNPAAVQKQAQQQKLAELFSDLFEQYQTGEDEARAANVARFEEIKGGRESLRADVAAMIDQFSDQQRKDVEAQFDREYEASMADLVGRGLRGSTLSVKPQFSRRKAEALATISDLALQRKIGLDVDLAERLYGFIERVQDVGPDASMLAQLAMEAGKAGGFAGFGAQAPVATKPAKRRDPFRIINVGGKKAGYTHPMDIIAGMITKG